MFPKAEVVSFIVIIKITKTLQDKHGIFWKICFVCPYSNVLEILLSFSFISFNSGSHFFSPFGLLLINKHDFNLCVIVEEFFLGYFFSLFGFFFSFWVRLGILHKIMGFWVWLEDMMLLLQITLTWPSKCRKSCSFCIFHLTLSSFIWVRFQILKYLYPPSLPPLMCHDLRLHLIDGYIYIYFLFWLCSFLS